MQVSPSAAAALEFDLVGTRRLWLSLAGTGALAVAAGAACNSESSGACGGVETGQYFQLQIYNYTSNSITMRLDGRFIGEVAPVATATPGTPGESLLGAFPICDKHVIDGKGTGGVYLTKICATPLVDSAACQSVLNLKPFCWLTGSIVNNVNQPPPGPVPSDSHFGSDMCDIASLTCDSAGNPGAGSFPCANACTGMWTENC